MDGASSQVHVWSLQQAPIPALVVSDVCLHLVIHLLICQKYPFDTCYLGKRVRDGEPCWTKTPIVLEKRWEKSQYFPQGVRGTKEKRWTMVTNAICHVVSERSLSSSLHPPPPNPDGSFASYPPAFFRFTCLCILFHRTLSLINY